MPKCVDCIHWLPPTNRICQICVTTAASQTEFIHKDSPYARILRKQLSTNFVECIAKLKESFDKLEERINESV